MEQNVLLFKVLWDKQKKEKKEKKVIMSKNCAFPVHF